MGDAIIPQEVKVDIQKPSRAHKVPILQIPGSSVCPVEAYRNMCHLAPLEGQYPAFTILSPAGVPSRSPSYQQFIETGLVHVASTWGISPHTVSGRVGQCVSSRWMCWKFWSNCRVAGHQIVIRSICRWVWQKTEQCDLDWLIMLRPNSLVKGELDGFHSINICYFVWRQPDLWLLGPSTHYADLFARSVWELALQVGYYASSPKVRVVTLISVFGVSKIY